MISKISFGSTYKVSSKGNDFNSFLDYIASIIPYILSWFHLPSAFITLIVGYITFKLSIPLAIHTIKLAIKWYDKLKP